MTSFLFNSLFPDGLTGRHLKPWFDKKLFQFADIIDHTTKRIFPFKSLQTKFSLPFPTAAIILNYKFVILCAQLYLQMWSQCQLDLKSYARWESLLISDIYRILIDLDPDSLTTHTYMIKWETYLGTQLSRDTLRLIWRKAAKSSVCISGKPI